ncbi:hypothetical protein NPIL_479031 [Nephila pilipes]|uniref:Uncharacterized protein n=1 Tax=Nephila pilipes TaxID=299642 RepID=A0A8X6Q2L0_NEPPI|nr:hypothetical protein NPIL_479031 [Nephila pilipes]
MIRNNYCRTNSAIPDSVDPYLLPDKQLTTSRGRKINKPAAEFKRGRTISGNNERSRRLKTVNTVDNIATVHQMVLDNHGIKRKGYTRLPSTESLTSVPEAVNNRETTPCLTEWNDIQQNLFNKYGATSQSSCNAQVYGGATSVPSTSDYNPAAILLEILDGPPISDSALTHYPKFSHPSRTREAREAPFACSLNRQAFDRSATEAQSYRKRVLRDLIVKSMNKFVNSRERCVAFPQGVPHPHQKDSPGPSECGVQHCSGKNVSLGSRFAKALNMGYAFVPPVKKRLVECFEISPVLNVLTCQEITPAPNGVLVRK